MQSDFTKLAGETRMMSRTSETLCLWSPKFSSDDVGNTEQSTALFTKGQIIMCIPVLHMLFCVRPFLYSHVTERIYVQCMDDNIRIG